MGLELQICEGTSNVITASIRLRLTVRNLFAGAAAAAATVGDETVYLAYE